MKQGKVKEFVKNHKKEIAIVSGIIGIGVAGVILGRGIQNAKLDCQNTKPGDNYKDLNIPNDWKCGNVNVAFETNRTSNIAIANLKISDMGDLGDDLLKIDGFTEDSMICALIGTQKEFI
jgi:hypothetical protein